MNDAPKTTKAWEAYRRYHDGFLNRTNAIGVVKECRRFYEGDQYEPDMDPSLPKPVMNICHEYVEKVTAKVSDTPYAVEFTAEDDSDMHLLDDFYEYQCLKTHDKSVNAKVLSNGFIDGMGACFITYDADTYGLRGLYRGYIKCYVPDFEDIFFANPYCEDPQDQRYLGFIQRMPVKTAREICENRKLKEFIVPDDWDWNKPDQYSDSDIGEQQCTVVTRYFRDKDGEVCFEQSTRYVDLFKKPYHLRPGLDSVNTDIDPEDEEYAEMSPQKTTYQEGNPVRETDGGYEERLKKFSRYPFAWFRPYPVRNSVLGRSVISQLIPTQKQINFLNMIAMLESQNHGIGKWIVQDGALADGQVIDNDPGQVIRVKAKYGQSVGNIIQRIEPSQASGEMINLPTALMTLTRQIYGFDNLTADNNLNDTSGYALQQVAKQQNLVLEIPQERFWEFIESKAETALLFFRDYIDEAKFYRTRTQGEIDQQESFRQLSQNVMDAYGQQAPGIDSMTGQLPETQRKQSLTITSKHFMKDFQVAVEVLQGIGQSKISESQHLNQLFQYILTGNADAGVVKALVNSDPAVSRKTRQNFINELDAYENSQINMVKAENEQLKDTIRGLQQKFTQMNQQVQYQQEQLSAYKKASEQNARDNQQFMSAMLSGNKSADNEGELKPNNSRGIEGTKLGDYSDSDLSL